MPKITSTNTKEINNLTTNVAVMAEKIINIEKIVNSIQKDLSEDYATKDWCESHYGEPTKQFKAIISLVVSTVVLAVIYLVIKK
jgi:hypothetical protein